MIALIYTSKATRELASNDLKTILSACRKNNSKQNVTGLLLFKHGLFMQLLEGHKANVIEIFERVKLDDRHTDIETVWMEEIDRRFFPAWSMGFCNPVLSNVEEFDFNKYRSPAIGLLREFSVTMDLDA